MNEFNCLVFLFDSTHQALNGERALKEAGISHAVINTPREFSVDCGISLRIKLSLEMSARYALEDKEVFYAGVEPYYSRWMDD
jgi:hypothetical protein